MKKLVITLALILSPALTFASTTVTCDGVTDSDKTLLLFVNEGKIVQLRVQTQGSLPKGFATNLVRVQADTSLYSVSGVAGLLEVQNSALNNEGGWLTFSGKKFECASN